MENDKSKKLWWKATGTNKLKKCSCGYVMSEYEIFACNYDYGCPRCHQSFIEFKKIATYPISKN